jgi:hypothetical protein
MPRNEFFELAWSGSQEAGYVDNQFRVAGFLSKNTASVTWRTKLDDARDCARKMKEAAIFDPRGRLIETWRDGQKVTSSI